MRWLDRARNTADECGVTNVEFRSGLIENLPVPDGWADIVISNGVSTWYPTGLLLTARSSECLAPVGGSRSRIEPFRPSEWHYSTDGGT
ncbi:MAG: hypothetical protein WEE53_01905 [Acidimicrobiia bacterium]